MLAVVPIRDPAGLAPYHLAWQALGGETPAATFGQSLACWRELLHRSEAAQTLVLMVEHDGRPLGIVPLWRDPSSRRRVFHGGPWGDRLPWQPVGRQPTATMLAAWRWLQDEFHDWDELRLHAIDVPGIDGGRTLGALRQVGCRPVIERQTRARIDLTMSWFEYWSSLPRELRNSIRWAEHKLDEQKGLEFVRWRPAGKLSGDDDPHWELYRACRGLAGNDWWTDVSMSRPLHRAAVEAGTLDVCLLLSGDQTLACSYGLRHNDRVQIVARGEASVPWNVRGLLLGTLLADSRQRGDRQVELADDGDARDWATSLETVESYRAERTTGWPPRLSWPRWWESNTRA